MQEIESTMIAGKQTPWGIALQEHTLSRGVFLVQTPEHGGLCIEKKRARALLSRRAIEIGTPWQHYLTFEQDSAMMVVFYEHPELYPWVEEELTGQFAEEIVRVHYPNYFL